DRGRKKRLYAAAKIPVYWIVNLVDRQVEVYTQPSGPCDNPDYLQCHIYGINDEVPLVLDGREVGRIAHFALICFFPKPSFMVAIAIADVRFEELRSTQSWALASSRHGKGLGIG